VTVSREYAGKVVVVTGAGSGIGRETALAFASRGASVVAADIDEASAARTAELAGTLGTAARPYQVDVGDAGAMEAFAQWVEREVGVPDVVVNNAGIGLGGPVLETQVADWERVLHVNLWGVIHGCRLFGRQMVTRGRGGHIVNVASGAAFSPGRAFPAYATTKAAVLMLSESLRTELAPHRIGVSAICPGVVDTGIVTRTRFVGITDAEQERTRAAIQRLYARRRLKPDKVAEAIVRAVRRNTAVVPVGPEVHIGRALYRIAPGLSRALGRVDLTARITDRGRSRKRAKR
jgi:NAD(P)-dependent dehydrogenase (short-subunit alcohol dehydrogenase family)